MKHIINGFSLVCAFVICLVATQNSFASTKEELIISCQGGLKDDAQTIPEFGEKIDLTISQTPDREDYLWLVKVVGDISLNVQTNGPINPDGSTISKNGNENFIFFHTPTDGIVLKKDKNGLSGTLTYVQQDPQKPEEWFLVEYALTCQHSGATIDQRETIVYNVRSELADIMDQKNTWINGVGIVPSETLRALGIHIYSQDEAQKQKFITEFKKRGLLVEKNNAIFYSYKSDDGQKSLVPVSFQITGDITPLP